MVYPFIHNIKPTVLTSGISDHAARQENLKSTIKIVGSAIVLM